MDKNKNYILVAEDEESMCNLIKFKLEAEGFEVDIATDGVTAFNKLQENNYGALILDLMLPQLDGMQILKKIAEEKIDLPVMILSAKSQEKDILSGLGSGADDYLTKPFRPAELIVRLKKMLEQKYD